MGLEIKIMFDFFFKRNKIEGSGESPWRRCFPCKEAGGKCRWTGLGRGVLGDFLWPKASAETQEPWLFPECAGCPSSRLLLLLAYKRVWGDGVTGINNEDKNSISMDVVWLG